MSIYSDTLRLLRDEERLREIPSEDTAGRVDLLSNDYLGLAARRGEFREEFLDRFGDASFTSSASRLLARDQKYHNLLEERLGELYGRPALLFNSGYHANAGALAALARKDTLIIVDKLMHASAIDGIMAGVQANGGHYVRFPHNDMERLGRILGKNAGQYREMIIVTESVFSMDGDVAPLKEIADLRDRIPGTRIYLDEAHAFGTRGPQGLGVAAELGLTDKVDFLVGTFGKAAASSGAFISASGELHDYLLNTARSLIFSTALPPACQAWTLLMLEKIAGMDRERAHLRQLSRDLTTRLRGTAGLPPHAGDSQIIPLMCGSAGKALSMAARLREAGFDCLPIRRPTVPPGGERIRISLNALLDMQILEPLTDILAERDED